MRTLQCLSPLSYKTFQSTLRTDLQLFTQKTRLIKFMHNEGEQTTSILHHKLVDPVASYTNQLDFCNDIASLLGMTRMTRVPHVPLLLYNADLHTHSSPSDKILFSTQFTMFLTPSSTWCKLHWEQHQHVGSRSQGCLWVVGSVDQVGK